MNLNAKMTSKILERAAELVERGWCQDVIGIEWEGWPRVANFVTLDSLERADKLCAVGALSLAITELLGLQRVDLNGYIVPEFEAVRDQILGSTLLDPKYPMAIWNDGPGRTADEVAALFRASARQ